MGETNKKFEVLSELIESLESRDTFQHTVELILHKTIAYINADCIALLQKGSDDEWTVINCYTIINYKIVPKNVVAYKACHKSCQH